MSLIINILLILIVYIIIVICFKCKLKITKKENFDFDPLGLFVSSEEDSGGGSSFDPLGLFSSSDETSTPSPATPVPHSHGLWDSSIMAIIPTEIKGILKEGDFTKPLQSKVNFLYSCIKVLYPDRHEEVIGILKHNITCIKKLVSMVAIKDMKIVRNIAVDSLNRYGEFDIGMFMEITNNRNVEMLEPFNTGVKIPSEYKNQLYNETIAKVGDNVRIKKDGMWTSEKYSITEVFPSEDNGITPTTYTVNDEFDLIYKAPESIHIAKLLERKYKMIFYNNEINIGDSVRIRNTTDYYKPTNPGVFDESGWSMDVYNIIDIKQHHHNRSSLKTAEEIREREAPGSLIPLGYQINTSRPIGKDRHYPFTLEEINVDKDTDTEGFLVTGAQVTYTPYFSLNDLKFVSCGDSSRCTSGGGAGVSPSNNECIQGLYKIIDNLSSVTRSAMRSL